MAKTIFECKAKITCIAKGEHYPSEKELAASFKNLLESSKDIDDAVITDVKVFVNEGETETGMWTPKPAR